MTSWFPLSKWDTASSRSRPESIGAEAQLASRTVLVEVADEDRGGRCVGCVIRLDAVLARGPMDLHET